MEYNCFYTKPENGIRFGLEAKNRLEHVGRLPCGGQINFLREDPLAALYEAARSGAKYDPTIDEDRWEIVCPYLERKTCPGWDGLRKMLSEIVIKRRSNQSGVGNGGNEYFPNGDANGTRIRNGNGVVGPIVYWQYGEIELPEEIVQVARECGEAAQAAEDAARADAHGEEVKVCHGGIIAFIRRIFGRRVECQKKRK